MYNNYQNSSVSPLRRALNNPVTLIVGIMALVSAVIKFSYGILSAASLSYLSSYLYYVPFLNNIMDSLSTIYIVSNVDLYAITFGVVFILFFAFSKSSAEKLKVPSQIAKVVSLICFIITCVSMSIVLIAVIIAMLGVGRLPNSGGIIALIIIITMVVVAVEIFRALFQFKFFASINQSAYSNELVSNCAVPYAVFSIISAVPSLIVMIVSFVTMRRADALSVFSLLCNLAYCTVMVIFAIKYNGAAATAGAQSSYGDNDGFEAVNSYTPPATIRSMDAVPPTGGINLNGTLTGVKGMYAGVPFPISNEEELIIGTDPARCNVIIEDTRHIISRRHCSVKFVGRQNTYVVTDFSSNGTYINGVERLTPNIPRSLPSGTVITVGDINTSFRLG